MAQTKEGAPAPPQPPPGGWRPHVFGVTVWFTAPGRVVAARVDGDGVHWPGNPEGSWRTAFTVAAATPNGAAERARAEVRLLEPGVEIEETRVRLVSGASHGPCPDVTIEVNGRSFTFRQPGLSESRHVLVGD